MLYERTVNKFNQLALYSFCAPIPLHLTKMALVYPGPANLAVTYKEIPITKDLFFKICAVVTGFSSVFE